MSTVSRFTKKPPRTVEKIEDILLKSTLVSEHIGKEWAGRTLNDYKIYKQNDKDYSFIQMKISAKRDTSYVYFDLEDLPKLSCCTWFLGQNNYVQGKPSGKNNAYIHHIITDFIGSGPGFQHISIDHNNGNPKDNRSENLSFSTPAEQRANTIGSLPGTKRILKKDAKDVLPSDIERKSVPRYVTPVDKDGKFYFVIEKHPLQTKGFTINGQKLGDKIKSIQALWVNQFAKEKVPYPKINKLNLKIRANHLYLLKIDFQFY